MVSNFQNFPDKAITVEFWMRSSDACNYGSPISYATGNYDEVDRSLMTCVCTSFNSACFHSGPKCICPRPPPRS